MFLDGVYARSNGGPRFYEQPEFHAETVMTVLEMIYQRLMNLFAKKGYVTDEVAVSVDDDLDANVSMPFRTRAPKACRRKGRLLTNPLFQHPVAGVIPPAWFNLTRFHGVFAPNHAWRAFVVPGPKTKRTCPAHDEPNDLDPPPTAKP